MVECIRLSTPTNGAKEDFILTYLNQGDIFLIFNPSFLNSLF